eukprot:TRINITY_DN6081_c0_g1_i3.p1 TRINITY_DN6081_c0_g1~~TRINITY_DN6081_c0_g1_i3.p1  ORF type:complete len:284 (+),score=81.65 TRINITY_DN6081_c0_g1_i3:275-1126(+)
MPIFVGYAVLGVAVFSSYSDQFASFDAASVTLFSLLNGDEIHDVFDALYPHFPVLSRIYLFTFIAMFIYAVLNIFIAIVEDAFFASKAYSLKQQKANDSEVDLLDLLDGPPVPNEEIHHDSEMKDDASILDPEDEKRATSLSPTKPLTSSTRTIVQIPNATTRRQVERTLEDYQFDLFKNLNELLENIEARIVLGFSKLHSAQPPAISAYSPSSLPNEKDQKEENAVVQDLVFVRPPHDKLFYPCGFQDCVYCSIRSLCESSLHKLDSEVDSLVRNFSAQPEN